MLTQAILEAVKARLQAQITDMRRENIYITSDENYIPAEVSPPCIGIRENGVEWAYVPNDRSGRKRGKYNLIIVVYSGLIRDETGIIGDESVGETGVLGTCSDVIDALDAYLPADGCTESVTNGVNPADTFDDGDGNRLVRQRINHEIASIETRPSKI